MAQTKKKARRTNRALLALLLALAIVLAVELVRVGGELKAARAEESSLTQQMQQQQQENAALQSDLAHKDDPEFIKELAREQLGLAESGERIFYDVNE